MRKSTVKNSDLAGDISAVLDPLEDFDEPVKRKIEKVKAKLSPTVTIILAEPADGSTEQFFGVQGKSYLIKFGQPVTVPRHFLKALDSMVQTKAVPLDEGGFAQRDFRRFPYQIVGA